MPMSRRMFMGKPGVYATKVVTPESEVHIPFLQAILCCVIILLDALFVLSWGLILPVGIVSATSIIVITVLTPTVIAGLFFSFRKLLDWMGVFPKVLAVILWPVQILRLFVRKTVRRAEGLAEIHLSLSQKRCLQIDESLSEFPALVEKHWTTISIVAAVTAFLVTGGIFIVCHDAWHTVCANLPHVDLPLPHVGGHSEPALGFFLICIGVVGFAFRPGKYSLGMTAFGGIVTAALQYFRPMTVEMTYGWTLPLYCIWGSICLAFIIGTATLYLRFYLRDILEFSDYETQRAPDIIGPLAPGEGSGYDRKY